MREVKEVTSIPTATGDTSTWDSFFYPWQKYLLPTAMRPTSSHTTQEAEYVTISSPKPEACTSIHTSLASYNRMLVLAKAGPDVLGILVDAGVLGWWASVGR